MTAFAGRVEDLTTFLLEERLPKGWEPRCLQRFGLTIIAFNVGTINRVEKGIDEAKFLADRADEEGGSIPDPE